MGKILVVDDRADFRQLVREVLGLYGSEVIECDDGDAVAEVYAREAPAWVVMDLRMKRVDGLAATRELTERFPSARVVVLTGYWMSDLLDRSLAAGAIGCLKKDDLSKLPAFMRAAELQRNAA